MKTHSKRFREQAALVDKTKPLEVGPAVALLKSLKAAKFDETVEVTMNLGIDVKQSDQQVRGSVSLPNGLGKSVKVIVFVDGEMAAKAKAAGALEAGADDL